MKSKILFYILLTAFVFNAQSICASRVVVLTPGNGEPKPGVKCLRIVVDLNDYMDPSHESGLNLGTISTKQHDLRERGIGKGPFTDVQALRNAKTRMVRVVNAVSGLKKQLLLEAGEEIAQKRELEAIRTGIKQLLVKKELEIDGLKAAIEGFMANIMRDFGITSEQVAHIPAL